MMKITFDIIIIITTRIVAIAIARSSSSHADPRLRVAFKYLNI